MDGEEAAWYDLEMKFARIDRTSERHTVATSTSTSSSPSNCDAWATIAPLHQTMLQPCGAASRNEAREKSCRTRRRVHSNVSSVFCFATAAQEVTQRKRAYIEVESAAVTALLVGVQIDATRLGSGTADKLKALVKLAQLVVGGGAISDNLHAVKRHRDVRRLLEKAHAQAHAKTIDEAVTQQSDWGGKVRADEPDLPLSPLLLLRVQLAVAMQGRPGVPAG